MDRFNIITFLKGNTDESKKEVLDDFIQELETTLIYVDKFEHSLYFDIYEYTYVFDYETNQIEISDELGISQSKVSKKLKKIDEYLYELLHQGKYKLLLEIIKANTKHKT